ncbi:hypothetical protein KKF38_03740 [Patescibacteria group bacterium]|nr:hypothetical protein [Patescibacteria group bacterium]
MTKDLPSIEDLNKMEDRLKSNFAKASAFSVFVFGTILVLINKSPLDWRVLLYFILGVPLSAMLCAPCYFFTMWISKKLSFNATKKVRYFYWIFLEAYNFLIAYLLFQWIVK